MRCLVIEDDVKLGAVLRQGLEEQGLAVDLCRDGGVGLEAALSTEYDVVVLDWLLPGQDGVQVLRALRAAGKSVPVLMLTARSGVEDRVQGLDGGADDYLPKPFVFAELMARLRAITRRPQVEPSLVLGEGDLTLDPARHEVLRGGRKIDLTAKEFSLLEYLLRKRQLVVTRSMILDHVWNMDYDGGSNLVEVYINYLRRKIEQDGERKLIHTIRGVGYVLRAAE